MSNINLSNRGQRENIIRNGTSDELNKYFSYIEKMAKIKGGAFKDVYNEDISFLVSLEGGKLDDEKVQLLKRNQHGGIFGTGAILKADTDVAYMKRIESLTPNSYCPFITQKTAADNNSCYSRSQELEIIKTSLEGEIKGKQVAIPWDTAITRYIDFLVCCNNFYEPDESENIRSKYLLPITRIIISDIKYTNKATDILTKVLQNEKNKYIQEYISVSKQLDKTIEGTAKYNQLKDLKRKFIEKYGFGILYLTELINLIFEKSEKNEQIF